jgi:hypothetical protein
MMQTVTIAITHKNALKVLQDLEEQHFIKIVGEDEFNLPSLPGAPLIPKEFKNWTENAENTPTIGLKEATAIWANKRKQLQRIIR